MQSGTGNLATPGSPTTAAHRLCSRGDYWPRPGRIFAAARSHSFRELAEAIDTAFARWDRAHLYQFVLADGRRISQPEFDHFDLGFIDGDRTRLGTLTLGEQFLYEFDFGGLAASVHSGPGAD